MSTNYTEVLERIAFAEKAARWFSNNHDATTFSNTIPKAGDLFAVRWGMTGQSVLVFRIDDEPEVYGDIVQHVSTDWVE